MHVCVLACAHTHRSQRRTPGVFLYPSSSYSLKRESLSLNQVAACFLIGWKPAGSSTPVSAPQHWDYRHVQPQSTFLWVVLPAEPLPQPLLHSNKKINYKVNSPVFLVLLDSWPARVYTCLCTLFSDCIFEILKRCRSCVRPAGVMRHDVFRSWALIYFLCCLGNSVSIINKIFKNTNQSISSLKESEGCQIPLGKPKWSSSLILEDQCLR